MRTDTIIRTEGTQILMKNLGLVDAERFIALMQREPFDYTKWQENLFEDMSIDEISKNAAELRKNTKSVSKDLRKVTRKVAPLRKKKEYA